MTLQVRECGITVARVGVARLHRHLKPPPSGLFGLEVLVDGWPVGWAIVGRPVSRLLDTEGWVEVTRVAVPAVADGGPRNGCSIVYGWVGRWGRRENCRVLTYTRVDESGAALRGAGWIETGRTEARRNGTPWSRPSRVRSAAEAERVQKIRWSPPWCAP